MIAGACSRPRTGIRLACIALLFLAGGLKAAERPNVLFIAIDDMNDYAGCLGGYRGEASTPNIDRLADRGVVFTNAHCSAPLCNPSRSSLLSGLNPSTTGIYSNAPVWHEVIPREAVLPSYFRDHGYYAAGGGKVFHTGKRHHPHDVWDDFFIRSWTRNRTDTRCTAFRSCARISTGDRLISPISRWATAR